MGCSLKKQINNNIRIVNIEQDAKHILEIYEPYILNTTITFEYNKIPLKTFQQRMKIIMQQFPWLVYEEKGEILGYAYASSFHEREAYAWDCEASIYIKQDYKKKGIGSQLYNVLFDLVKRQGYYNIYALIAMPNPNSVSFHKKHGFQVDGIHKKTGYKFGQWIDLMMLSKTIGDFQVKPEKVKTIEEVLANL